MQFMKRKTVSNDIKRFSDPEDVDAALRNKAFSVIDLRSHILALGDATGEDYSPLTTFMDRTLLYQNGKEHLTQRRMIAGALSDTAVAQWRPMIAAKTAQNLERLAKIPHPDLVSDFIDPLFCDVIGELIGLEAHPSSQDEMIEILKLFSRFVERNISLRKLRAINGYLSDQTLFSHYVKAVKPGAAIPLTAHLHAQLKDVPDAHNLIRNSAMALMSAAHSAAAGLGFSVWGLLMRGGPAWADAGRDGWLNANLEQTLNAYLSSRTLGRVATSETVISGCPMHKDQGLVLELNAANTTMRREWLKDDVDPSHRGPSFAFGAGQHKCPGEAFARAFISIALPALSQRFPNMVLHRDRTKFMVTSLMHAPVSLPCTLNPTSEKPATKLWDIKDHDAARAIVADDATFAPPQMEPHLRALQDRSGKDLGPVIRIAKNAMFFMSGKRHADARRAVTEVLGQNRLRSWHTLIDARINANLDRLQNADTPDLIHDFANPVFREITKPILGFHPADIERFDELAPTLQDVLEPLLPLRQILHLQTAFAELLNLINDSPSGTPNGPLSLRQSMLKNPPAGFDPDDIAALVLVLYGASFNLSHTLGNSLHWILSLPIELRGDVQNPDWTKRHLEEIISNCASPKFIYRHAKSDHDAGDAQISAHDTTRIHLNAVNNAKTTGHMAFGHGLHHCVGASLSRALLRRAIPLLFNRFPKMRLLSQGHTYFEMSQTVAMESLPCVLEDA